MKKDDCIFCKLANGDIPTNSIYEDEDFKVILDAAPATRGHCLILPKEHFSDLLEADEAVLAKVLPIARKIAKRQKDVLKADGVNILQNNGSEAGQTVFHLHIHIVPRYEGEKEILTWGHQEFSEEETKEIQKALSIS